MKARVARLRDFNLTGRGGRWAVVLAMLLVTLMPLVARAHGEALELDVEPTEATASTTVTVTGVGFGANQIVELRLTGPGGDAELGSATTDGEGAFALEVTIPGATVPGLYLVRAENGEEATAELTVGAMPGMASTESEASEERDRSGAWAAIAIAALLIVGALGVLIARPDSRQRAAKTPA